MSDGPVKLLLFDVGHQVGLRLYLDNWRAAVRFPANPTQADLDKAAEELNRKYHERQSAAQS